MNLQQVLTQIQDLPTTYLRSGTVFAQWMNAYAEGLARFTNSVDALTAQMNFDQASGHWLDVWGLAYGIPRNNNEVDANYSARISATLVASHGTPVCMVEFLNLSLGIDATITENIPAAVGYTVTLQSNVYLANYAQITQALDIVRPAGVPYSFAVPRGGLYLSTINYFGRPRVTGAYLTEPTSTLQPGGSASTNNTGALLPTTYLTDPVINPSL